jgi:hypothetical protein
VGVALILLVALVIIGVYAYVRRKRNLDLYREHWKIPKQQIKVIENKAVRLLSLLFILKKGSD